MSREHILLTGATGLLGGAVLAESLQDRPDIAWTALIRGRDEAHARARLAARLGRFTGAATAAAMASRVRVIPGDVFAIGALDPALLADTTRVLHLAADTSYWSRESNWQVNFEGTMAMATAAAQMPALRRFLHVGTATICGRNPPPVVREEDYPREGVEHIVHYTLAKASTETALAERLPELPVVIARPSIVAGNSRLGSRPSASIFWFVRCAEALGLVTCDPRGGIDIVPSDWTASALLHLLLKPALAHRCYHLSAGTGSRSTWPALAEAFAAARGDDRANYPEHFALAQPAVLRERFAARFGRGDARLALMLKAARKYYEFCALDVTFDNSRLLAEGMAPPPSLAEYLEVCLAEPPGQSILDAFLDDVDMFDPTAVVPAAA
jgi:nucleoside-diphosphate-sugar epimerase